MNKIKKIGGFGMIILFLLFLFPQKTQAQYTDILNTAKEYALDPVAYVFANMMLNRITAQTVNWINSGFQGSPAYVTDPGQFFLDIADIQASKFLAANGALNQLCVPFRANVRLSLVKNYLAETSGQNYYCSLSAILNNYDQFTQDFSQGGWNGWFEITQNNSNNPYGSYLEAKTQMQKDIDSQVIKYNNQLNYGRGFLSFEKCAGTEVTNNATGKKDCIGKMETVTPGSTIQTQLDKVLGSGEDRIVAADEIDEIIGALLSQLISRVIGGVAGGLRGSSQPNPATGRIFTTDIGNEPAPPPPPTPGTPPIPPCESLDGFLCEGDIPGGGGGGGGGTCTCPNASQEEIDAFLAANPGDEGRLCSAFPCP